MANRQITELPVASSAADADLMLLRQSAADKQVSVGNVRAGLLRAENDLDDVDDVATARTNLGVAASADTLLKAGNLSGLASASTARTNLGLGTAAVAAIGASSGNVVGVDNFATVALDKYPRGSKIYTADGTFTVPSNIYKIGILCLGGGGGGGGGATAGADGVDGTDGQDSQVVSGLDTIATGVGGGDGKKGTTAASGAGGLYNGMPGSIGGRGGLAPFPQFYFPDQGGGVIGEIAYAGGSGGAGTGGGGTGGGGGSGLVSYTVRDIASGDWGDSWDVVCGDGGGGGAAGGAGASAGSAGSNGVVVFFW